MSKDCGHYVYQYDYEANCPICQIAEIERLRARIEELEKGNAFVGDVDAIVLASQGKHIITDEQIDAAWAILQRVNKSLSKDKSWRVTVEHILEPLGIVRCEICTQKKMHGFYECEDGELRAFKKEDCPSCNGHGWIKCQPATNTDEKCG